MRMLQALLGVGGGLLVGALACVAHPGPVDLPWVGLLIAAAWHVGLLDSAHMAVPVAQVSSPPVRLSCGRVIAPLA